MKFTQAEWDSVVSEMDAVHRQNSGVSGEDHIRICELCSFILTLQADDELRLTLEHYTDRVLATMFVSPAHGIGALLLMGYKIGKKHGFEEAIAARLIGEREAFEKWANAKGTMGNSWNGECYDNILHESAWQAWQAARAAEAPDISKLASSIVHYVLSEIRPRPDDPSCHVCGAIMVPSKFRCLSCGGETGANGQASPAPAPCEACELENKTGDEHTNHACRTTPTGAREIDAEARAIAHCYSASTHSFRSVSAHLSRAEAEVESLRKELALSNHKYSDYRREAVKEYELYERQLGEMQEALRLAKTRLEICLGRMRACNLEGSELSHEVSLQEIPAWIEDMETLLSRKEKSSGDDGTK